MSQSHPSRLTDDEIRLLRLAEYGHTFCAADAHKQDFDALVHRLRSLRDRGLLRFHEGRIMMSHGGGSHRAGPCDLTEAGRQALERDRRLGPRA